MNHIARLARPGGLAVALLLSSAGQSLASDHIDGVKTTLDNSADATDLFTFTSPTNPSRVVLIMNVNGVAFSGSRFSNAVDYVFRLRPITNARTLRPSDNPNDERTIACTFTSPLFSRLTGNQRATCRFNLDTPETISFDTRGEGYRAGGSAERSGIRVFAGVRSDPWFLDLAKALKYNAGVPVLFSAGINGLHGQNVLSIVVEIDKARLPGPLLAITARTVRK